MKTLFFMEHTHRGSVVHIYVCVCIYIWKPHCTLSLILVFVIGQETGNLIIQKREKGGKEQKFESLQANIM